MKQKIVNLLKYNKTVYAIYHGLFSFLINFLRIFVKTDDKLILFNSFAGRKYDDSPKAIFEAIGLIFGLRTTSSSGLSTGRKSLMFPVALD